MKNFFLILLSVAVVSCTSGNKQDKTQAVVEKMDVKPKIELLWASDTLLRTPESVLIDRERNVLYVSNVNMNPWEKDGNGFISKMDLSGNIIELKWIEGLSGPKGMGIYDNMLFIADIDEVVAADVENGEIIARFEVEGKTDLNDITVGANGTVYISGSASNAIYSLKDETLETFHQVDEERLNGLYWEMDRLLLITSGTSVFKSLDWNTKELTLISENMGHGDAIAPVGDGGYLTTSWAGAIFYVSAEGEVIKLLDTEAIKENAADLDYSIESKILYVPTFFDNRVKAYKLVKE